MRRKKGETITNVELQELKLALADERAMLERNKLILINCEKERKEELKARYTVMRFMAKIGWKVLERVEKEQELEERGLKIV